MTLAIGTAALAILVIDHDLMPLTKHSEKRKQLEEIFMTKVPRYDCFPILGWLIDQRATMEQLINKTVNSVHQYTVQRMRMVCTEAGNKQDANRGFIGTGTLKGTDSVTIRAIPCMAVRELQHVIAVNCWIGAPSAIHLANREDKKYVVCNVHSTFQARGLSNCGQ